MSEQIHDLEPMNPIYLTDEEGKEHPFEQLDYLKLRGNEYVALVPIRQQEGVSEEDGLLIIMKVTRKNGTDTLFFIEDDREFSEVAALFTERLSEDYEIQNDGDEEVDVIE